MTCPAKCTSQGLSARRIWSAGSNRAKICGSVFAVEKLEQGQPVPASDDTPKSRLKLSIWTKLLRLEKMQLVALLGSPPLMYPLV